MVTPSKPAPVVLVTGCSAGGIGYALCEAFAARGCKVYATARDAKKMPGLDAKGCVVKEMDVTQPDAVNATVASVLEAEGRIDVLVNNAGVNVVGSVIDVPVAAARKLFETNYWGCLSTIQAVAPAMIKQRSGCIINIGSVAGYVTAPFGSHYSASKAALRSLTDALRLELQPLNINVVYSAPGFVLTKIFGNTQQQQSFYCLPTSPYYSLHEKMTEDPYQAMGKNAVSPEVFAKRFAAAVLSSNPPRVHRDGQMSWTGPFLAWLLPSSLMDKSLAASVGMIGWKPTPPQPAAPSTV